MNRLKVDQVTEYCLDYPLSPDTNQLLALGESVKGKNEIIFEDTTDENFPVEIMRINKDGMTYKGTRIEDAGEAHRLFLEVMELTKRNIKKMYNKSLNPA